MRPLTMKRGETFEIHLQERRPDGTGFDLAGYGNVLFTIKNKAGDTIATATVGDGLDITDRSEGKYAIIIADTREWLPGSYVADTVFRDGVKPIASSTIDIIVEAGVGICQQ